MAAAGIDLPDVVVIGWANVSNGPSWPPFTARRNERLMRYEVLQDFAMDEWAECTGAESGTRKKFITANDAAAVVNRAGGEITGGSIRPEAWLPFLP